MPKAVSALSQKRIGVSIHSCKSLDEIRSAVSSILSRLELPSQKSAKILIKPNLNSDMIGLTGNTTDLRILSSIVTYFTSRGYTNLVIADGTSSGFINIGINVISRLRIDKMAEKLGAQVLDLNIAPYEKVRIGAEELKIAKICFECELFINVPKLKTHAEAGMSMCMKNLMGCIVGLDKQKMHNDLAHNISLLGRYLKPSIHIVDALFAMEGTGPSRGIPKKLDTIIGGDDALETDLACAKLAGFDIDQIPYLEDATKASNRVSRASSSNLEIKVQQFVKPTPSILFRIINHKVYRKFFVKIRYMPVLNRIFSSTLLSEPLYSVGARQDMFSKLDSDITKVRYTGSINESYSGSNFCPMGIDIPRELNESDMCIQCLYCYFSSNDDTIEIEGKTGYLSYQIDKYLDLVRKAAK